MPDLKIIYITGFNVDKNAGRNKATREKSAALQAAVGKENFKFKCPGFSRSRLLSYLRVFLFDLRMLPTLFFVDKNVRIIQRTTFLPLTNIYLRLRGVRIIYELHTDFKDEIKHYHVGRLEKLVLYIYVLFERLNLRLASAIIYNHPVLQEVMRRRYKKPSIYSYNGANIYDFVPLDKLACRREMGLEATLNYYVFVGSVAKWRGVDLLVEIFNKYMDNEDRLLVIGNTSHTYGREIKQQASGNPGIIFKDEMGVEDVVKYINAADICLVPVKPILTSPGNPLKLYDYIACGQPVAGQEKVTGCADEIIKYNTGIVTDFYNTANAAAEIKEFVSTLDAGYYRVHNRKVAVEEVSWEKRIEKWIKFLKEI